MRDVLDDAEGQNCVETLGTNATQIQSDVSEIENFNSCRPQVAPAAIEHVTVVAIAISGRDLVAGESAEQRHVAEVGAVIQDAASHHTRTAQHLERVNHSDDTASDVGGPVVAVQPRRSAREHGEVGATRRGKHAIRGACCEIERLWKPLRQDVWKTQVECRSRCFAAGIGRGATHERQPNHALVVGRLVRVVDHSPSRTTVVPLPIAPPPSTMNSSTRERHA